MPVVEAGLPDTELVTTRRSFLATTALTALAAGAGGYAVGACREAVAGSRRRVAQRSAIVAGRDGAIEYAVAGRGAPLLMVHGTGGGFDQGLRFADKLVGRGFQVIAPSRFGYLGSDFPDDPTPARQADAFVELLDRLGIERTVVAGGSAGALPAAEFALRHPDRCSHLVLLVPAANLTGRDPVAFTASQRFVVDRVLTSDVWFWMLLRLAPDLLLRTLLATDPALLDAVGEDERRRAELILHELLPIGARARGIANDGHHSARPAGTDFSAIAVPTLVLSCEDDRFGTAETARTIASRVPASRLVVYPSGGHVWLGHDADVAEDIVRFVGASS